jgi:hypothetical protein
MIKVMGIKKKILDFHDVLGKSNKNLSLQQLGLEWTTLEWYLTSIYTLIRVRYINVFNVILITSHRDFTFMSSTKEMKDDNWLRITLDRR